MHRSHGPSVYFDRETGEPVVKCSTRTIYCGFLSGGRCTEDKMGRKVPDDRTTPEWCGLLDVVEDAREMIDFDRMGLTDMRRPELLIMAKELPDEFRPQPLNRANVWMLRRAIRKAKLAEAQA